jgi:energy-coupling factor transport system ATP-binding protein
VIHCTQDMETAASGDGVIFLEKGKIRHTGTPEDVFASLEGTAFCPLSWRCQA